LTTTVGNALIDIKAALTQLEVGGNVVVKDLGTGTGCSGLSPDTRYREYEIEFNVLQGDIPALKVYPTNFGKVSTYQKGVAQFVAGSATYRAFIRDSRFYPRNTTEPVYVRVGAINSVGTSEFAMARVSPHTPSIGAPLQPSTVKAVSVSATKLTVTWDKPTMITLDSTIGTYELEYDTSPTFSYAATATIDGFTKTYTISDLIPGVEYYVRVRACAKDVYTYLDGNAGATAYTYTTCGGFGYEGFPHMPIAVAPVQVPGFVGVAHLALQDPTTISVDWTAPDVRSEGANGAPVD
jgi:hypothetical protein